jgi:hypothetical protein
VSTDHEGWRCSLDNQERSLDEIDDAVGGGTDQRQDGNNHLGIASFSCSYDAIQAALNISGLIEEVLGRR